MRGRGRGRGRSRGRSRGRGRGRGRVRASMCLRNATIFSRYRRWKAVLKSAMYVGTGPALASGE